MIDAARQLPQPDECAIESWGASSRRLLSLLDMLRFNAHLFVTFLGHVNQLLDATAHGREVSQEEWNKFWPSLGDLRHEAVSMDLQMSVAHLKRIGANWRSGAYSTPHGANKISADLGELINQFFDELKARTFFAVNSYEAGLYESVFLSDDVIGRFPSIRDHAEEAGKCLALGRATACVYHLMLVMEAPLRALYAALEDPVPATIAWGPMIGRFEKELKKRESDRATFWREHANSCEETVGMLRNVKNAWRNPTLHIERMYNVEQAADILEAVDSFMRHLSTDLVELSPTESVLPSEQSPSDAEN